MQGTINGYGERCGNANLVSILPALQLKLGYDCVPAERLRLLTETAHFVDELTNAVPDPDQPYVGRNAFAHKGGMHVAGVQADARTFEHIDPKLVGNSRDVLISELSGRGLGALARRRRRDRARRRRGQARRRADQGARAPRLSLRGRRRLVRAAPAPRDRRLPVAVPARELPRDHREARRRAGRDRGDDQDLGRGAPLRPHRRGQRPGQRARPRAARRDRRAAPAPRRHRADRLQGPDPRLAPRHRRRHPGAARLLRRPAVVGLDRRLGEHHRGLVGGARRLAGVRVPAQAAPPVVEPT